MTEVQRFAEEEMGLSKVLVIGLILAVVFIATAYVFLTGGNKPPSPSFTYSPISPITGENLQFTDASSDGDGYIVSWLWDFGDGTTSTAKNPTHQYTSSGTYPVTLTVRDDDKADEIYQTLITVTSPPAASGGYTVYDDNTRIPLGADIWSWPNMAWQGAENDVYVKEEMGVAPEGVKYRRTMVTDGILCYAGWGVIFIEDAGGIPLNFSAYQNGHIVFWLRGGNLEFWGIEAELNVQLEDDQGGKRRVSLIGEGYWTPNENWQEISIPISAYSGVVDLSRINYTFQITVERVERDGAYFDVDYIRWLPD